MSDDLRFLIHPGFPKCGSTTLQESVFKQHSDCNYLLGYSKSDTDASNDDLYRCLRRGEDAQTFAMLYEKIASPQIDPARLNVLSQEGMLFGDRPFRDALADVRALISEAKILLVVRPQIDLLRSYYDMMPYISSDPKQRFLPFADWLRQILDREASSLRDSLRFIDVAEAYRAVYEAENVTIVAMETFFKNPGVRREVCRRVGIDAEESEWLLQGKKQNSASQYRFRHIGRRILGPLRASSFLTHEQIGWIGRQLNRFVLSKKTNPSSADKAFVAKLFRGQEIADLAAQGWEGMFL